MIETRNILHSDGRLEIRRVISADNLEDWDKENPLAYERSIVWIRPVMDCLYVRTAFVRNARSRRGPLLTANYQRRVFYLMQEDLGGEADVQTNANCMRPESILPTQWGQRYLGLSAQPYSKRDIREDSGIVEFAF